MNASITEIEGNIATIVIPGLKENKLNLTEINATLTEIEGTVGLINFTIGIIETSLENLNITHKQRNYRQQT